MRILPVPKNVNDCIPCIPYRVLACDEMEADVRPVREALVRDPEDQHHRGSHECRLDHKSPLREPPTTSGPGL